MATRILIVDDSPTMRAMVRGALEADRHQVLEAKDGREALAALKSAHRVDLVITDVHMPEMDGLSLVRALRRKSEHRLTPVLVVTTEASEELRREGKEAGATGWIQKPFRPEELRETVCRVLARRRE